ncbi:hypothetical protein HJFPF1_05852 [Paramyrothecium foliicola]|nr:hypothetical protein HJFPF1_05852 [Paramyrothecium foliicola]
MRILAFCGLISLANALPTTVTLTDHDNTPATFEQNLVLPFVRNTEHSSHDSPILMVRAIWDLTYGWPAESNSWVGDHYLDPFQIELTNLHNGKYRLNWWNSDRPEYGRKLKLTFNAGGGTLLFEIITTAQTRGNTEVTKQDSTWRGIVDVV